VDETSQIGSGAAAVPRVFRWLRDRPAVFGLVTFVLMFVIGLRRFDDARVALAGGSISAVLNYFAWRPRGWGWRLDARQRQLLEQRGDLGVRPAWLIRAAIGVVGALCVGVALVYVIALVV
jgi:hypothetical protein